MRERVYVLWLWIAGLFLLPHLSSVVAQPFYFGNERPRESTSVMASYTVFNFEFDGDIAPNLLLNFDEPAYGLTFSRSNLAASIAWGRQNAPDTTRPDISLLDLNISLWADVFFSSNARTADHRLFSPIMLFTNYRRVRPSGEESLSEFNITTLGLGLGLGYYGTLSENALVEVRTIPAIGYASQSFGESAGVAQLVESDVQLHIGSVFGRIGLSFGYAFRLQIWNVNARSFLGDIEEDLFSYRDTRHTFSLGVNW